MVLFGPTNAGDGSFESPVFRGNFAYNPKVAELIANMLPSCGRHRKMALSKTLTFLSMILTHRCQKQWLVE